MRTYYRVDDPTAVLQRVLIVEDEGLVTVYCPPVIAGGPWLDPFNDMDLALDLAALLAKQSNQATVLITRDKVDWWLNGLSLIGDADEVRRQSTGLL